MSEKNRIFCAFLPVFFVLLHGVGDRRVYRTDLTNNFKTFITMKKYLVSIFIAFSALVMLNGCVVSEQKLTDKVKEAIVNDEQSNGKTLEVTEFSLDQKEGKTQKGVLKGKLDGEDVVYDVKVVDEGSDFDVDWELKK